jgi:uncharacterized protein (DUF2267 family)
VAGPGAVDPNQTALKFFQQIQNAAGSRSAVAAAEWAKAVLSALLLAVDKSRAEAFLAALPVTLRDLLRRDADDRPFFAEISTRAELVDRVRFALDIDTDAAEPIVRSVLDAALVWLARAQVLELHRRLPPELRDLWR